MAAYCKVMYSIFGCLLIVAVISANPVPEKSKIRIHVPIKHHTHYHTRTKTIIKPVHVPIKTHHFVDETPLHKHHRISDVEDEQFEDDWAELYANSKKKKYHPFI